MDAQEKLVKVSPAKPKTPKKMPRYLQLANELREEILSGDYTGHGDFPTESVLCKKYDVSRFTVREALRKLTTEGLIIRKRGSGTVVQRATARAGALHQPLSNVGEILQYARDTTISYEKLADEGIPENVALQIGVPVKGDWHSFQGVRLKAGRRRPVAVTRAWIHPNLTKVVERLDLSGEALFGQIEKLGQLKTSRVTQDIQAIKATEEIAENLGVETDDPVLRILRCYFNEKDDMFEVSASYHPGERFAYSMHIEVD